MNPVRYVCIFRKAPTSDTHPNPSTRTHTKRSRVVFDACTTTFREVFGFFGGSKSDDGRALGTQLPSTETKLQIRHDPRSSGEIMPIENENVGAGIDNEAIEFQRPYVVAVGRGPTCLEIEETRCVRTRPASNLVWCVHESTWNRF